MRSALLACVDDNETDVALLIGGLREDLTSDELFGKEETTGATVIRCCFKEYITTNGVLYMPHPESARVTWGLMRQMYANPTDREIFYKLVRGKAEEHKEEEIEPGRQTSTIQAGLSKRARIMTAMTSRFKYNDDKFEGQLGDSLYDAMAAYLEISNDRGLNQDQTRDYLHHLFYGEAKTFHSSYVEGTQGTFATACATMAQEYNSLTSENRCRSVPMKMTLPQVMRIEKLTTTEALEFISNKIKTLADKHPRDTGRRSTAESACTLP